MPPPPLCWVTKVGLVEIPLGVNFCPLYCGGFPNLEKPANGFLGCAFGSSFAFDMDLLYNIIITAL